MKVNSPGGTSGAGFLFSLTALRLPEERRAACEGRHVHLQAYSDTDAAGDPRTRRSQSSVKIFADDVPLHPHSRLQKPVSTSSGTSEFYGRSGAAEEAVCFRGSSNSSATVSTLMS